MKYLDNKIIKSIIDNSDSYVKKEKTLLRKPNPWEIGTTIITYVKDGDNIRIESSSPVNQDSIIAKNPNQFFDSAGKIFYNIWPINIEVVKKNYGEIEDDLTFEFQPFQKIKSLKAVQIDDNIISILGCNDKIEIDVSWSDKPMIAIKGDYLTDGGYSISAENMKDYEEL